SSAVATSPARPAPTTTTSASMPRLCQRLGTDLGLLVPLLHDLALGEGLGAGLGARLLLAAAVRGRGAELLEVLGVERGELARDEEGAELRARGDPALRELLRAGLDLLLALALGGALLVLHGVAHRGALGVPDLCDVALDDAGRELGARHHTGLPEGLAAGRHALLLGALGLRGGEAEGPLLELLLLPVGRDLARDREVALLRVGADVAALEGLDAAVLLRPRALRLAGGQAQLALALLVLAPELRELAEHLARA